MATDSHEHLVHACLLLIAGASMILLAAGMTPELGWFRVLVAGIGCCCVAPSAFLALWWLDDRQEQHSIDTQQTGG